MITKLVIKQGLNKKLIQPIRIFYRKRCYKDKIGELSIISMNCAGGTICHDYGIKFNTPTINLFMSALDYITFAEDIDKYCSLELAFAYTHKQGYPVGKLGGVLIHFLHYPDFGTAKRKWDERKKRVNYSNILLVLTNQNGCTEELVERFSKLPYKKIMFSDREYEGYDFIKVIPQDKSQARRKVNPLDEMFHFVGLTGREKYEKYYNFKDFLLESKEI